MTNYSLLLNSNVKAELARRRLLNFVQYVKPNYEVNWHHQLLCEYLMRFISGEITRLMVWMPPQHGKQISHHEPVLTTDGWATHGDLKVGDYVFGRDGKPVRVLALSVDSLSEYDVRFSDGTVIQCHGNHEWVVHDRSRGRERVVEAKYLATQKLRNDAESKRGNRNRFQVDQNTVVQYPHRALPVDPYVLGAWLGDGSKGKNCITHAGTDTAVIEAVNRIYPATPVGIHKGTGVRTTYFKSLYAPLSKMACFTHKHIPVDYLISNEAQRLQLLAGLIDTDGYVYHKNGRVTFSNTNRRLISDVKKLVLSLGWRCTISSFEPALSTSGIAGKQVVYQLCFNPDRQIPVRLDRKRLLKINPAKRKRGIESVTRAIDPKPGRCIQVEGGVYLVGETLIPTHNSELVSRQLPAFILGRDPKAKVVVSSYSANLSEGFNRDTQRIIGSPEYADVFPGTTLNSKNIVTVSGAWLRNSEIFETVGQGGFLKSTGVGGALTGTAMDFGIIDDPVKDSIEAMSPTYQQRNWDWFNDVFYTRIHNKTRLLITQTRWNVNDLSGKLLQQMEDDPSAERWTVLSLPAVKVNDLNHEDPRAIGEPLWPDRHSMEKLMQVRARSIRTYMSLYQQDPKPTQAGGEFYHSFDIATHVQPVQYDPARPIHATWDFNVKPGVSCGLWQLYGKVARQFGELRERSTTKVCAKFKEIFQGHDTGLFIYGDPAGEHEDTRSEDGHNDFVIIMRELLRFRPSKRVAKSAPSVKMRGMFINAVLATGFEGCEIEMDETCHNSIEDMQFVKEDAEGLKLKARVKDPNSGDTYEQYGHYSDAMDYFLCWIWAGAYALYSKGTGVPGKRTLGKKQSKNAY